MEEGSLLEQALKSSPQAPLGLETESTKNVLILDLYPLRSEHDRIQRLLRLAKLANTCNTFLQSKNDFHWHYGGDGPVFGVHVGEEGIPHLRAYCRYGPSVADEWMAIEHMLTLSQELDEDVAISCWDAEDGQVILIQTAEVLPDWLDQDPTDTHHYACWIRKGKVQLLRQSHASLSAALEFLRTQDPNTKSSHPKVQDLLQLSLSRNQEHALAKQRTPLVVPRQVASVFRNRPDLVHAAIQAFCDHIEDLPPDLIDYSDWVWTMASLSRTNYAMLRTMVSSEWKTAEFVPPTGVEVKRYKRQCTTDATPHVQHAVQLGVRIVAGLEFLSKTKWDTMSTDKRIAYWSRIGEQCQVDGSKSQGPSWILQSYQQGPNHAQHDLTDILKCPVFPEEAANLTLRSHPEASIKQQLLNAQKIEDADEDFPMPLADQVDDESWLTINNGDGDGDGVDGTNDLDTILSRFQNFMVQPSEVEGVAATAAPIPKSRRDIRPRVFMNILHSVLKGDQLSFPQSEDPFFYKEDYDLMEESEDIEASSEMRGLMDAMDMELEAKTRSRDMDTMGDSDGLDGSGTSGEVAENAHVLNNLLQSLEASAGEAGPVPNMLKGMGSEPPKGV